VRSYNINGIVLKGINFKDSDKIFSILTREMGRISVLARGVRKISSRRAGNLDTLNLICAKITEGSKGFKQIEEVRTVNSFRDIKKSYDLSRLAFFMAELVYRNLEEGENSEQILSKFVSCLKSFSNPNLRPVLIVNYFELELLKELGYEYQPQSNFVNSRVLKVITELQKGRLPKNMDENLEDETNRVISTFLYQHLDQKIKSLELS
jgi:DNA repair protein RecO (recombination protein O)